jgi:holo-[acyl-carrier protein] synthase
MILGLGMDLVEIGRVGRILDGPPDRASRFLTRCFTAAEREYCDGQRDRAGRYAARFAAKEAAVKALGAPTGIAWTDIEVLRSEGAPSLRLHGPARAAADRLEAQRILLTLTHDAGVAAATVILEGRAGSP